MTDSAGPIRRDAIDIACALATATEHPGRHTQDAAMEIVNGAIDGQALAQRFLALAWIADVAIAFGAKAWQTNHEVFRPGTLIDESFGTVDGVRSQVFEIVRRVQEDIDPAYVGL